MQRSNKFAMAAVLVAIGTTGCAKSSEFSSEPPQDAAKVETVKGVDQVTLSSEGVRRLGIETGSVSQAGGRKVIPYASVLYAADGSTFTFVSPKPRVYHEAKIVVDRIDGSRAILKSGPATGTSVVTVGSAELIGTAHGVEEG
jgi:multidrug efflux pump subunit AcrA (membrane-fusion protein)